MDCCYTPSGKKVLHAPCRGTVGTGITGKRDGQENGRERRANGKARDVRYLFTEVQILEPWARGRRIRSYDVEQ
jgi:hypothetical protein